jgi:hypothetical protein
MEHRHHGHGDPAARQARALEHIAREAAAIQDTLARIECHLLGASAEEVQAMRVEARALTQDLRASRKTLDAALAAQHEEGTQK